MTFNSNPAKWKDAFGRAAQYRAEATDFQPVMPGRSIFGNDVTAQLFKDQETNFLGATNLANSAITNYGHISAAQLRKDMIEEAIEKARERSSGGGGIGGILSGALSGASAGASFGPWGAVAGGVLGGVSGAFG